jgi:hypothetical protein
MLPRAIARMSYAEYLALEATRDIRHEYSKGEVFAMAGGTITHRALTAAVTAALSNALHGRPCRVLSSDVACARRPPG